ncbi:insulinase family protein, partial [Candidatus Desantisbacteria bacterium]|nr:insulinase family protein [Candidatus Desantisbacteria bacterium]
MIKKVLCFVFVVSFSVIASVFAFDSTLLKEEKVNRYVLDNGMIVLLKENHSSPVAAIQILVKTGSSTEGDFEGTGISHFVEHMLFKGTKKRKVGDIPNEIKEAGGTINAYTTYDYTGYHTVVASRYFDIGLDVLADSIMNSIFDEDEFDKEKDVILKEINMNEDDPRRSLYLLFWNTAFTSHPYRYPVIGYRSLFSKLTRDDLLKYYREKYIPNNMVLIAVGDINSNEAIEKIRKIFKDYSRGKLKSVYIPQEQRQMGKRELIVEKDINVVHMIMGYHGPDIFSHDIYALDVLSIILGEGRSSRLFKELKEKKQLIYSVRAFSNTPKDPGIVGISFTLDKQNVNTVQEACIKEIEKIYSEGVTEDEIKKAVTQVESDTIFSQQTVEAQAGNILSNEVVANNINFSKIYLEGISKVTGEDIKKVISKYFTQDNLTVAMIIPRQSNGLDSSAVKTSGEVKSENKVKKTALTNGVRVLTKENQDLPIINIKAVFQGGVRYENEKNNGISNFIQTMVKKGTKTYSAEMLNDTIESIGGSLEAYNGDNSFGFTLNVLKRDFDKGLKLLNSVIFEPTFPQEEIDKERKNILMSIRTREDNVFGSATRL